MDIKIKRNITLFASILLLWIMLITIEVILKYSGVLLQVIYLASIVTLLIALWNVNHSVVAGIKNEIIQFISRGVIAVVLTGVFVFLAVIIGVNYKFLIGGTL